MSLFNVFTPDSSAVQIEVEEPEDETMLDVDLDAELDQNDSGAQKTIEYSIDWWKNKSKQNNAWIYPTFRAWIEINCRVKHFDEDAGGCPSESDVKAIWDSCPLEERRGKMKCTNANIVKALESSSLA